MSEGVRWKGHSHLVQKGLGVFRQMDKQPDRQRTEAQPRRSKQSPSEGAWHILSLLLLSSYTKAYLNVTVALNMHGYVLYVSTHTYTQAILV